MTHEHPELKFLNASQNGAWMRNKQHAVNALRAGLKPGHPDINLPVGRGGYFGLYIEMKNGKNKPTDDQLEWLHFLANEGYLCFCIWGAKGAIKEIENYLKKKPTKKGVLYAD